MSNPSIVEYNILEFTPLEFETSLSSDDFRVLQFSLEFTPLEFETNVNFFNISLWKQIRIYSVGVWNESEQYHSLKERKLEFTPLEFETRKNRNWIYQ